MEKVMNETVQQLTEVVTEVVSEGEVKGGKLVGEYDFYSYLAAMEGKKVRWSLQVVQN